MFVIVVHGVGAVELTCAQDGRGGAVGPRGVRQEFRPAVGLVVWCHGQWTWNATCSTMRITRIRITRAAMR